MAACGRTCPYKIHGKDLHTNVRIVEDEQRMIVSEQRGRLGVSREDSWQ